MRNSVLDLYNKLLLLYDAARNEDIVIFMLRKYRFFNVYDHIFPETTTFEPDTFEGKFDILINRLCNYLSKGVVSKDRKKYLEETWDYIIELGEDLQRLKRAA